MTHTESDSFSQFASDEGGSGEQRTGPMSDGDERRELCKPTMCTFLNTSPEFASSSSLGLCTSRSRDPDPDLPCVPSAACTQLGMATPQMCSAMDLKFCPTKSYVDRQP